ncbi:MAG: PEP-CTERM sorting domain-containing protein [Pedosphaera sp.]|nr:PEP-CTERM sorting domain-containing protein [Pedosphaera sp.]
MKRISLPLLGLIACVCLGGPAAPRALATATATGQISFSNLQITPSLGALVFLTNWYSSTFAQATATTDFDFGPGSVASSAVGDYSAADGQAIVATPFGLNINGAANASANVPGQIVASDSAAGRGGMATLFMITGGAGPVNALFSVQINGSVSVFTDTYGLQAEAETIFSLELDGSPTLFDNRFHSIGQNDSASENFSLWLNQPLLLDFNTTYFLRLEADAEAYVSNVPEPGTTAMILGGLAVLFFARRWFRPGRRGGLFAVAASLALLTPARAAYIGSEPPQICLTCGAAQNRLPDGNALTSLSEGNLNENYPAAAVMSSGQPTLELRLSYNSYDADASRARVDTGLGFGWTHSHNIFLFQQRSHFFRWDGDGRVTQYRLGPGGVYTADSGFFEKLAPQPDGSLIVTNKEQSWWRFALIPNSHFLVNGDMYRLTQMGDRNTNVVTLAYTNGCLHTVADQYGRTLTFGYTNQFKLAAVTDPLGRVTRFQYDPQFRSPTRMTDADGKVTRYSYNSLYQMTRKIDRDGRTYFYTYKNQKPFSILDGNGQTLFSLSNPTGWDTDRNVLAQYLRRQYVPTTTSVTNGRGFVWRYTYDTNGYITRVTAPDGATSSYAYDPAARQVSAMTNANGAVTRYSYDSRGNKTNVTDALGNVTTYTYEPSFNQMTSATDPNGRVTTYQYDTRGNRVREIDPLNQTNSYSYDGRGRLTSQTDRLGRTTTYTYDSVGNRTNRTDALGNVTTYTYDGVGNRVSTTDALGRTTTYTYDARDRMAGLTNALGDATTSAYDGVGRVTQHTDANGNTTSYGYDTRGRLAQTTDALGNSTTSGYDANNNRTSTTNQIGHVTDYTYDSRDRMIRETNAIGGVTSTIYDGVGNRTSATDPLGRTSSYAYDSLNRLVHETNALNGVTRYDYGVAGGPPCCTPTVGSGHITRIEDPNGKVTFFKYDELNRTTKVIRKNGDTNDVIDLDDAILTTAYDPVGNRVAATDPNGNVTTYAYDALNRLTNSVNPAGDTTSQTYDGVGNQIITTSPNGNITTSIYDSLNRRIASTDAGGLIATNVYDSGGNRTQTSDALGHTTTYTYDALDRRTATTDALGNSTTSVYDAAGNVTQTTDRQGRVTTYTYDALERHTALTNALGQVTTYTYDGVGNRTATTDARGLVTTYTYDSLNRRTAEIHPDPAPNTVTYTYDSVGNRISRTDQQGRVTTYTYNDLYHLTNRGYATSGINELFTYDLYGRMLSANRAGWVLTFTYDAASRVITTTQNGLPVTSSYNVPGRARTNTYPSGRVITETTDARERLVTIHDGTPNPHIADYTYDAADRVLTRTYRNGTYATYTYNSNNWVTSLEHSNGVARIAGFSYAYDEVGEKLYEEKRHLTTDSEAYAYDALHRLTNFAAGTLVGPVVPSPTLLKTWTLDPLGNWTSLVSNTIPELRSHNAANEITLINGNPISHDNSGNLSNDGVYAYSYDEENRLTQVQRIADSAIVGRYYYDALNRRVIKIANASGTPVTNVWVYDGSARIIEERNAAGATLATYTYGNYVDEVLTMDRGGSTYYYHQNSLWSPSALSDSSGNVAERYTYDVYGCVTVLNAGYAPIAPNAWGTPHSALTNSFLFTGRELDEESGLYHFRARAYHCGLGRFLQRDPIGPVESENLYLAAFVPNSLDPSGNQRIVDFDCTEGGFFEYRIDYPECRCHNRGGQGVWVMEPGGLKNTRIVVHPTRTYTIEKSDGSIVRVTCRRLQAWKDATKAHEDKHRDNDWAYVGRLNGVYATDYESEGHCYANLALWGRQMREYSDVEGRHAYANSPQPTDCRKEYDEESAVNGQCDAPQVVRPGRRPPPAPPAPPPPPPPARGFWGGVWDFLTGWW